MTSHQRQIVPLLVVAFMAMTALQVGFRYASASQPGTKAPDFRLPDTTGKVHTLADFSGRVLVLAFWSFKCPVSMVYDERLRELQDKYGAGRLAILEIDSNSNETRAEIERNASNRKLPFAILLDEDGSLADKLQATLSPSYYVIDAAGTIRYQGSLDNNKKPGDKGRIAYIEQALDDIFAGRPVADAENPASGCTIRRRTF